MLYKSTIYAIHFCHIRAAIAAKADVYLYFINSIRLYVMLTYNENNRLRW